MIEINKQGNAIRIDFTDNDKYLFNGTMEVASNELMLVVDESDMITFKRATNGDVLFSQIVDNIKISGSAVTKDNVIEQFATIGYNSVTSVNGQTGDVVLTATSLGAITKADADTLYATKSDLNSKADISAVEALSTEVAANRTVTTALTSKVNEDSDKIASLDTEMDNKANSADVPTNTQFNNLAEEVANKADKTSVYTKQEADDKFATNTQVTELTDDVRTLQTDKQDKLVSGTTIKTVNGESILGSGNLVIQSGASNWDDIQGKPQFARVATSGNYNDLINKPTIPDVSGLATKEEIADMETKSNAAATYATKAELNTKIGDIDIILDSLNGEVV